MATLSRIARDSLGVELEGTGRFAQPGWTYRGPSGANCPDCGCRLHDARKPYLAAEGRPQEYRAYLCPGCPRIWDRKGLIARLLP